MGKWNNRYRIGRRKNYNYQEPPPSPPRTQPLPYGRSENGVPSWEIDFCYLSGVTWHKISTVKKFMFCHDSVLKWNDFAGEEAFHNARRRYWEKINGLPCEDSSPDPDMYIGKVDWNSHIDPELMLDLDREYFNPDNVEKREKSDTNSKGASSCLSVQNDKNTNEGENPWDSNTRQGTGEPQSIIDPWEQCCSNNKDTNKGKNYWESNPVRGTGEVKSSVDPWEQHCIETKSIDKGDNFSVSNRVQGTGKHKSSVDPWEQYYVEVNQSKSNNAWRDSIDESSLWHRSKSQNIHSSPHVPGSRRIQRQQCAGYIQTNGRGYVGYNSWQSNQRRNDFPFSTSSNDRQQSNRRNNSERMEFSEFAYDDSRRLGLGGQNRGGRGWYDGCRKREGSMQHASRNKSARFQDNDYGTSYR